MICHCRWSYFINWGWIMVRSMRGYCLMLATLVIVWMAAGCGGGGGKSPVGAYTGPTTSIQGTLTMPIIVNSDLLANISRSQNTDSEVRNAIASATVVVNGHIPSRITITPSSVTPDWPIRLEGIPVSTIGKYDIDLKAGKVGLKAQIRSANQNAFVINSRTTAAALLAPGSGFESPDILASYPAIVSVVTLTLESVFTLNSASVTTSIFTNASLTQLVSNQADFLKTFGGINPGALVAYLGASNDLDGDGYEDLKVEPTVDGTRIRFETALSKSASLKIPATILSDYSDNLLLDDFTNGNTREDRTFDRDGNGFILGLKFKRGASQDRFLKLLVKRIDIPSGVFKGVVVEYAFVLAPGTALSHGVKTLIMDGAPAVAGAVQATNFLDDKTASSPVLLNYLGTILGLGGSDGTQLMVSARDPGIDITTVPQADVFSDYLYKANTKKALEAKGYQRSPNIGDVFSAYFSLTRHYAIFKITQMDTSRKTLTLDYIVNASPGDNRFQ